MHFFSRKPFALGVLTLLTLFTVLLLDSRTVPAYAATHHDTSVASQATTNNHKGAILAAGMIHGCPSGFACVYPENKGWNNNFPSLWWEVYGSYQLHNQNGNHYVFNNQTGDAGFWLCTDWSGNNCPQEFRPGEHSQINLTPINSIKITSFS